MPTAGPRAGSAGPTGRGSARWASRDRRPMPPASRPARRTRRPRRVTVVAERAVRAQFRNILASRMQAVTFQAPGEVLVEDRPEPELAARDDAVVRVEATGVCGSDLHIYHGRVAMEQGFTLGHEFVGTVVAAGDGVTQLAEGDRVLGCFCSACGNCFFCRRGDFHKCDDGRVFGHGKTLGSLQGAQAEQVLVPHANLTLRRVPDGMPDDIALFAGDVMGTGWHAIDQADIRPGDTAAVLGLGPVGLCAVQAAKAAGVARVIAIDSVPDRLALA